MITFLHSETIVQDASLKIVIAGGTGLIGSAMVDALLREGHSITILSRSGRPSHRGASLVLWDATNVEDWFQSLSGVDAVVNLSGESLGAGRWTKKQKDRITSSRVRATRALAEAIGRVADKPRVLVNASAVGYYGHVDEAEVNESSPPGADFLAGVCVEWEAAASSASAHGTRVVMLRTGFVLSPDSDAFRRMVLPFRLFAGGPYGSGRQWFPWIHLADVVSGYLSAIQNESLRGPVNLVAPNPVRVNQLAKALGKSLRRPSFLPAPAFALRLALGEMADLLLKGQRVLPEQLKKNRFIFRFPTLAEALDDVTKAR